MEQIVPPLLPDGCRETQLLSLYAWAKGLPILHFYSAPRTLFQSTGTFLNVYMVRPKIGLTWKDGVAKHHLTFYFPQR